MNKEQLYTLVDFLLEMDTIPSDLISEINLAISHIKSNSKYFDKNKFPAADIYAGWEINTERQKISDIVKQTLGDAAKVLNVQGYCRIDAFVRINNDEKVEVIFIEVNSLPGMTPATCIFHQTAINGYKPYDFIDRILEFGVNKKEKMLLKK